MNRTKPSKTSAFIFVSMLMALAWIPSSQAVSGDDSSTNLVEKSDLNKDRVIDTEDLSLLASKYLQSNWIVLDWCEFYDATLTGAYFDSKLKKAKEDKDKFKGKPTTYYKEHFKLLLTFINDYFDCAADPQPDPDFLGIENDPKLLLRAAKSADGSGDIYFTDPKVGSLFIYDAELALKAEIKDLDRPLGVAVDSNGYILIGNDGRDNIEVFDPVNGNLVAIFGEGQIIMPSAITTGPDGHIYVTDSRSHSVRVFDTGYNYVRTIGSPGQEENELYFPVDTEVISQTVDGNLVQEIFVADQGNKRIQIYDTQGELLGFIGQGRCGMMGCRPPTMTNLQALDVDASGRLHALDNFGATVSIFDSLSGAYLSVYGEYGEGPGFLGVPFDLVISDSNQSIVTSGDGARVEVYPLQ